MSDDQNLVKRGAAAIAERTGCPRSPDCGDAGGYCVCMDAMRAAIEAMREPTADVERRWQIIDPVRFDWGTFHAAHRAMIDAALRTS